MQCYECFAKGIDRAAVGFCHHCSAALCAQHASVIEDPVTTNYPMLRTAVLPKRARILLCNTCKEALQQQPEVALHA